MRDIDAEIGDRDQRIKELEEGVRDKDGEL
jgi:hypothetical protein